jgi:hypothetical protein
VVSGQTDATKREYEHFARMMGIYGYGWEPIKVHTDDGYTLTMMHVTGKNSYAEDGTVTTTPGNNTHGPILIQSSMGTSPDQWLDYYFMADPTKNAVPLHLYDDGFDVYFSFSRGTVPSRVHDIYSAMDAEFWDFSWYELGMYDTKA